MTKPHRIRNKPWLFCSNRIWLLSILLLLLRSTTTRAQPTFDECKIFLVASDTARDLSLNKEPEYVRFLNLVARTYLLQDDFTTFDGLPLLLQTTYKAYAWTDAQEIDISAAAFGASSQDGTMVLRAFCEETANVIASLLPTLPPTWAPTEEQTKQPTPPEVSYDQEATLLTGPSSELSELPIECRRGLFGSDSDKDGLLNRDEYALFLHQLLPAGASYVYSMDFAGLPQELKDNYDRLMEDDGHLHIFGAVPSQWAEASSQQRSFLQLICYRTEDAIQAVNEAEQHETTTAPTLGGAAMDNGGALSSIKTTAPMTMPPQGLAGHNQTAAKPPAHAMNDHDNNSFNHNNNHDSNNTSTAAAEAANGSAATAPPVAMVPPTTTTNVPATSMAGSSSESSGSGTGNVVGAVVGSLLIVLLGGAMARDKQNRIPRFFQGCWRKRISPFAAGNYNDKKPLSPNNDACSEALPPTSQSQYDDFDSSYNCTNEQTGFLEDHRVAGSTTNLGGITNLDQDRDEESQVPQPQQQRKSSTTPQYGFQTVRFNPDEFHAPPPQCAKSGNTMRFNPDDFLEDLQSSDDEDEEDEPEKTMDDPSERFAVSKLSSFEERMINDDFHEYQYDTTLSHSEDDSSAMSLYCSSVPGDEEMPTSRVLREEEAKKKKKKKKKGSVSTHETDLLTEFSSPRRNSKTMYHANRFGKIAQSESNTTRNNNAGSVGSSQGGQSVRKKKKPKPNWRELQRSPPPAHKEPILTNKPPLPPRPKPQDVAAVAAEPKTPKAANKKRIKKKPSSRKGAPPPPPSKPAVGATKKKKAPPAKVPNKSQKPTMPIPTTTTEPVAEPQPEAKPVDRFLRYAMDMSDSSDTSDQSHSSGFSMEEEEDPVQENHSTGFFLEDDDNDDDDDDEPDKSSNNLSYQSPTNHTQGTSSALSFVYGGKSYSIDAADVSPKPMPNKKCDSSQARKRMQFTEITLGSQDDDSDSESTSFLSDDFTDPGDEVISHKKKKSAPPPPRPNATRRPKQAQRKPTAPKASRTKTPDTGDKKPRSNHQAHMTDGTRRDSLSLDESITDSVGSCSSSFLRDSQSSANKSFLRGDSDSTYEATESSTFTFPPESSSSSYVSVQTLEGDPISEIHRLVAIVMPSEQDKVTRMLSQYQGREGELLKTLQRLEVRQKARQFAGRPIHAMSPPANKNDRAARMRTIRQKAAERRRRSSVVDENAAMIAATSSASDPAEARRIFSGGPMSVAESERSQRLLDLDMSSSDEEDDFSQDSTYFDEDQHTSCTSFRDDDSLSHYSDLI